MTCKSERTARRTLKIENCASGAVKVALKKKRITKVQAEKLASLPKPEQQSELDAVVEENAAKKTPRYTTLKLIATVQQAADKVQTGSFLGLDRELREDLLTACRLLLEKASAAANDNQVGDQIEEVAG